MASTEIAVRHTARRPGARGYVELPLIAPLPKNTIDPRYAACVEHRTGCDCREAVLAEDRNELRAELDLIRRIFNEVLAGHATWVEAPVGRFEERLECKCTGCEIARRAGLRFDATVVAQVEVQL
ncbi:MAG: hypothetical protein IRZ07_27405 [Microbispora sp.]|nr:hypothetical protein [Microbispora sp.]